MNLMTRIVAAALGFAFSSGVLTAEAAQTETGAAQINRAEVFKYRDEMVTFEITAAGHAKASYLGAPDQRVINAVVIRGERNDLRADPEAPPYALDIRISDNEDVMLAAKSGTGHLVDHIWNKELSTAPLVIDDQQREQDFAELTYFATALREQIKPRLEKSKLSRWAWIIDELANLMDYTQAQSKLALQRDDSSSKATYTNRVTIKKKRAYNVTYFDHSALSYTLYKSDGRAAYTIVTCNHGTCADSSNMNLHCSKTFTQSTVDAWASDLLCDLYGWPPGVHVCNNDTRAEYLSIKNKKRGTWSSCSTPRLYAPPCD